MKTNFKRSICVMLVIFCIFSFTGCANNEPEARAVAEGFMNAVVDLDLPTAVSYVNDESMLDKTFFDSLDMNKALDVFMQDEIEVDLAPYAERVRPLYDGLTTKIKDILSYEITGVEEEEDKYIYTVNLTMPTAAKEDNYSQILDDYVTDSLSGEELLGIATKLLSSGEVSRSSSVEDMVAVIFDELMPRLTEIIENFEFESVTEEQKIVVKKIDGKWLIDVQESVLS